MHQTTEKGLLSRNPEGPETEPGIRMISRRVSRLRGEWLQRSGYRMSKGIMAFCLTIVAVIILATAGQMVSASGEANLVTNPGFEQTSASKAVYWNAISDDWGGKVKVLSEAAQSGDYGISIATSANDKPWVSQFVPVQEGATYTFSTWFRGMGVSGRAGFKFEFRKADGKSAGESAAYFNTNQVNSGQWSYGSKVLTAPPGATQVRFYLRMYGTGTIQFDNAAVELLKPKPQARLETDEHFYYADAETIQATATVEPEDGIWTGKNVQFRLLDADSRTLVFQTPPTTALATVTAQLDPSLMQIGQPYELQAVLLDTLGEPLSVDERVLYRWNRPQTLPDGHFVRVDDEPFFPVIGYHAEQPDYPYLADAGINTIQTSATRIKSSMKQQLDGAQVHGLKALVCLYSGGTVKENMALITDYVSSFKDHPAVLGWYLIDEPSGRWIGADELSEAYQLIRSLDPKHPVYLVEADDDDFLISAKGTDILATDPYPLHRHPISTVGEYTRTGVELMGDNRPVWTVLQTFKTYEPVGMNEHGPTRTEFRNMAYQAILGGATGLGYYSLNDPDWVIRSKPLWDILIGFRPELELISALVLEGEKLDGAFGPDSEWGLWRHGSDLYAIAVNLNEEAETVSVPLEAAGFFYERLFEGEAEQNADLGQQLHVQLTPQETAVYKITLFRDVLTEASADLLDKSTLLPHPYWEQETEATADLLARAATATAGPTSDIGEAIDTVAEAVSDLRGLLQWAAENPAVPELQRAVLTAAISDVLTRVEPVVGSLAAVGLSGGEAGWLSGGTGALTINVRNQGDKTLGNVSIRLDYPQALALPPAIYAIGALAAEQTEQTTFSFAIPAAATPGDYSFRATVAFDYDGTTVSAVKEISRKIEPTLVSAWLPSVLEIQTAGVHGVEWQLTNRTAQPVTVTHTTYAASGITVHLPTAVTLAAYGTAVVQGTVTLPNTLASGSYEAVVVPTVGSAVYASATLDIRLDRNLQMNPGFEQGSGSAPIGWTFNNAIWDRTVAHSGSASARVEPSGTYNRIYPTSAASVPIETGRKYQVSAWVKNDLTSGPLQLRIRQVSASVETVRNEPSMTTPYGSDWTYVTSQFTAVPGAVKAMLYFGVTADSVGGPVWLDDVSIEEVIE